MEYNENENENQNIEDSNFFKKDNSLLKEKNNGNNGIWYLVIGILILGILGWYGYTAGWFSKDVQKMSIDKQEENIGVGTPFESSDEAKAPISNITVKTSEDFPVQKTLVVKGELSDGCMYLNDPQVIRDGSTFYVNLTTREEGDVCTEAIVPYERNIELDVLGLPAGVYSVIINGKETIFELEQDNAIDFSLGEEK